MIDDIALVVCGLGLFFAGLHLLTASLRKVSSRRFRNTLSRWTHGAWHGLLWGVVAGALTQSMTAVLFMLIGLVRTGAIGLEAVYPLVAGANLGSSVLALLTAFNIDLVMMVLLGLSGFLIAKEKASLTRAANVAFGAGVLFLGLHQVKAGAVPLLDLDWIRALLGQTGGSAWAALAVGTLLRLIVHSSVAIVILGSTLAAAKVLTLTQAVGIVVGVVAGSAGSAWMLSLRHQGRAKQVVAYGMLANLCGAAVMLVLLFVQIGGVPTVVRLLAAVTGRIELQVALALSFAYVPGVALTALRRPVVDLFARLWPPTEEEGDSVSRFINDDALADPESAVDLALMEQRDLTRFFSRTLERARANSAADELQSAFGMRVHLLNDFIEDLAVTELSTEAYEKVAALINSQRLLEATEATVHELAAEILHCGPRLAGITDLVVESLDTVLLTFDAVLGQPDEYDMLLLRAMTGNRSAALQRIRESFVEREAALDTQSRLHLLTLTNLCERFFWLMGSFIDTPVCGAGRQQDRILAAAG